MAPTAAKEDKSLCVGIVSSVQPATYTVRCILPDRDEVVTGELIVAVPCSVADKGYGLPAVDTEGLCLFTDCDALTGYFVCAGYNAADQAPTTDPNKRGIRFEDGATLEYDKATHTLTVVGGVQSIQIEAANVAITGNVTLTGSVNVAGTLTENGRRVMVQ